MNHGNQFDKKEIHRLTLRYVSNFFLAYSIQVVREPNEFSKSINQKNIVF